MKKDRRQGKNEDSRDTVRMKKDSRQGKNEER